MSKETIVHSFDLFREVKKKEKENKAKGPVDLKSLRQKLNKANKKNRTP